MGKITTFPKGFAKVHSDDDFSLTLERRYSKIPDDTDQHKRSVKVRTFPLLTATCPLPTVEFFRCENSHENTSRKFACQKKKQEFSEKSEFSKFSNIFQVFFYHCNFLQAQTTADENMHMLRVYQNSAMSENE